MAIFQNRWCGLASAIAAASVLSGCASGSPALNSFGEGMQKADAEGIVARALTEPMASLAGQSQSGSYRDELAYIDAQSDFHRSADSPGTSLSDVTPIDDGAATLPIAAMAGYAALAPIEKSKLRRWSDGLAPRIRMCLTMCGEPVPAGQPLSEQVRPDSVYAGYVISDNLTCAGLIPVQYEWHVTLKTLANEVAHASGRRQVLAYSLWGDLKESGLFPGALDSTCGGGFQRELALYGQYNPGLEGTIVAYLRQELDEKSVAAF